MEKFTWLAIVSVAAAACGGSTTSPGTVGGTGTSAAGSTASGITASGSTASGITAAGSTVATGTANGGTGTANGGTGTANGGTGTANGGSGTATGPTDGGPANPTLPPITATMCGNATCTAMQECCVNIGGGGMGNPTVGCVATGRCMGGLSATCSSAASCATAGDVCCASINFGRNAGAGTTSCQPSCAGDGGGFALQLCTTDAECPPGDVCQRDNLGLDVCRTPPRMRDGGGGGGGFDGGGGRMRDGGGGGRRDGGGFMFDGGGRRPRDAAAD